MKKLIITFLSILSFIGLEAQIIAEKVVKNNSIELLENDTLHYKLYLIDKTDYQRYESYFEEILTTLYNKYKSKTIFIESGIADEWLFLQSKTSKNLRKTVGKVTAKEFNERYEYLLKKPIIDSINVVSISIESNIFYSFGVLRSILLKHKLIHESKRLVELVDSIVYVNLDTGLIDAQGLSLIRNEMEGVNIQLRNIDSIDYVFYNDIFDEIISRQTYLYSKPFNDVDYINNIHYYSLKIIDGHIETSYGIDNYIVIVDALNLKRGRDLDYLQGRTIRNRPFVTISSEYGNEACTIKTVVDRVDPSSNNYCQQVIFQ